MVHGQCARLSREDLLGLVARLPALRTLLPGVSRVHCPGFAEELEFLALVVGDYAAGGAERVPPGSVRAAAFALLAFEGDRELFGDAVPGWGRGTVDDMRVVDLVLREHEATLRQSPHAGRLRWPGGPLGAGFAHPYPDQAREGGGSSTEPANHVPRTVPLTVATPR